MSEAILCSLGRRYPRASASEGPGRPGLARSVPNAPEARSRTNARARARLPSPRSYPI